MRGKGAIQIMTLSDLGGSLSLLGVYLERPRSLPLKTL
jgi:hypothetical protein